MPRRLTRITTKGGDDGTTGLGDGTRVPKDDPAIIAIGDVDELNSWLGVLATRLEHGSDLAAIVQRCQHLLFDLGGELAMPGHEALDATDVEYLERCVRELNRDLPDLDNFILPGGNEAAAICHVARSVCRRAERAVVHLTATRSLNPPVPVLLNRLSDLLFVIARLLARQEGGAEVLWQPKGER